MYYNTLNNSIKVHLFIHIQQGDVSALSLHFVRFDVGVNYGLCSYTESLTIYDGNTTSSTKIANFCNMNKPPLKMISWTGTFLLHLVKDGDAYVGFKIFWSKYKLRFNVSGMIL